MLTILKKSSFFILIAIVVLLFLFFTREDELSKSSTEVDDTILAADDLQDQESEAPLDTSVIVDIKGQVEQPGVYEVEVNARVNDVIDIAGGFKQDADETQVNLAERVQDEMIIMIPKEGEEPPNRSAGTGNGEGKVKINYATQEEIETLSGIGPSKAQAIIQHREEHGLFKSVEDLLEISGIGEKTLENMKDDIQIP